VGVWTATSIISVCVIGITGGSMRSCIEGPRLRRRFKLKIKKPECDHYWCYPHTVYAGRTYDEIVITGIHESRYK